MEFCKRSNFLFSFCSNPCSSHHLLLSTRSATSFRMFPEGAKLLNTFHISPKCYDRQFQIRRTASLCRFQKSLLLMRTEPNNSTDCNIMFQDDSIIFLFQLATLLLVLCRYHREEHVSNSKRFEGREMPSDPLIYC